MNLESKIEAILFFRGEPVSRKKLAEILGVSQAEINEGIMRLKEALSARGITVVEKENEVTMGTVPEMAKIIEDLQKEELDRDLSKASLETLSIVVYKGVVSRAEIDFIRGVNSSFTLRALSVRGLIEKIPDSKDNRRLVYKPSFDLLSYLGVKSVEELPQYEEVNKMIKAGTESLAEMAREEELNKEKENGAGNN